MLKKLFPFLLLLISIPEIGISQYGLQTGVETLDQANFFFENKVYDKSLKLYNDFLRTDTPKVGAKNWLIARMGIAISEGKLGNEEIASELIFETDSKTSEELSSELKAYLSYIKAEAYYYRKNLEKRRAEYEKGLDYALSSGNKFRIAQLKYGLMKAYTYEGDMEEALEVSEGLIETFSSLEKKPWLIEAYLDISYIYRYQNNRDRAETLLFQAVDLSKEIKNNKLLQNAYSSIGEMFKRFGNYDQSLIYYNSFLELAEKQSNVEDIAKAYNDIGAVYSYLGDGKTAINYYNRSVSKRAEAGLDQLPLTIMNIALVYHSYPDFEKAKEKYFEALKLFEQRKESYWITRLHEYIADLYLDLNDHEKALFHAKKSVEEMESQSVASLVSPAYLILARTHSAMEADDQALIYYKKSYEALKDFQGDDLIVSLMNLSEAYYNVKSDSAFYYADKTFEEIEWLRGNIYGDRLQTELFRYFATFFFKVASWELEMNNDIDRAFEVVELGKSRSLLDQIAGVESLENFVDEASSIRILQKGKELDQLHRKLESATNDEQKKELRELIADTKLEYEVIVNETRRNNPNLKRLESPKVITANELQKKLDKETVFVEYGSFGNKLIILMVSSNSKQYAIQEVDEQYSRQYLSKRVNNFRRIIQEGLPVDSAAKDMQELYSLLIEPVAKRFNGIKNLLIVPDVSLSYLPFEALKSNNGKYLIEEYNIKYIPSGSLLEYIPEPHRSTEMDVLAVAGSGFQSGSTSEDSRSQNSFASLPSTLLEVDSISTKFEKVTKLKNEDVSEAGIKKIDLSKYRILHFATHGTVNEDDPSQSGLLLSKRNDMEGLFGEDGLLNSAEISLLKLNSDLVVLSACNTGYGRNVVGEGLLGLQRSFLKAGASSVMVSLWSVYDKSTALMMAEFYQRMNDYQKKEIGLWSKTLIWLEMYEAPVFGYKENALRDTKLAMLEHPYYNHPVNWAPFVLIGK